MPANASPEPEVARPTPVEADPLDAALAAANLLHAVVVMKGAQTWIVDPQGAISPACGVITTRSPCRQTSPACGASPQIAAASRILRRPTCCTRLW
jgi:hypothetical protein